MSRLLGAGRSEAPERAVRIDLESRSERDWNNRLRRAIRWQILTPSKQFASSDSFFLGLLHTRLRIFALSRQNGRARIELLATLRNPATGC